MFEFVPVLLKYRRAYKNWFRFLLSRINKRFPVTVIIRRTNKKIILTNRYMAYNIAWFEELGYDYDCTENIVSFYAEEFQRTLEFKGAVFDGDLQGVFGQAIYSDLNVKEKIVIDVGANIGDSAIYFALRGASRVIALEPFPATYKNAIENVQGNDLAEHILVLNAGCGKEEVIRISSNSNSSAGMLARDETYGVAVEIYSLKKIVENFKIDSAILKMDCEGCEYEAIGLADDATLAKFELVSIEFHNGVKQLDAQLERLGFEVIIKKRETGMGEIRAVKTRSPNRNEFT